MLLTAKENAFICKKQKSTPKKRIFRVPYAIKESSYAVYSTPYVVKLEFLLGLLDSLGNQFRVLMRQKRVLIQQKRQPKAIKERLALHLFIVGQAVKRHINSDGSCAF